MQECCNAFATTVAGSLASGARAYKALRRSIAVALAFVFGRRFASYAIRSNFVMVQFLPRRRLAGSALIRNPMVMLIQ